MATLTGTVTVDATAPAWAQRLVGVINREFQALTLRLRSRPFELARYQPGDLPDATHWPGHLVAVWTGTGWEPRFSDGADWRVLTLT